MNVDLLCRILFGDIGKARLIRKIVYMETGTLLLICLLSLLLKGFLFFVLIWFPIMIMWALVEEKKENIHSRVA
jgi:hypothetical protein